MTVHVERQVTVHWQHPTDQRSTGTVILEPTAPNRAHVRVVGNPYGIDLDELQRAIELVRAEAQRAGYVE